MTVFSLEIQCIRRYVEFLFRNLKFSWLWTDDADQRTLIQIDQLWCFFAFRNNEMIKFQVFKQRKNKRNHQILAKLVVIVLLETSNAILEKAHVRKQAHEQLVSN